MRRLDLRTEPCQSLSLGASDRVEVRSAEEILATLDEKGKLGGIAFTPQMVDFCGKTFRISKKANRIILESTGERRILKKPMVMLEGAICNGKAHGGCDRSCFYLWPEAWLKKTSSPGNGGLMMRDQKEVIADIPECCQSNFDDLLEATLPDPRLALWLRRYWWRLKRNLWHLSILGVSGYRSRAFPSTQSKNIINAENKEAKSSGTSSASLHLQPGDYVEVRPLKEIFATLDRDDKLNGMRFNKEMAKFSGYRFKVYRKLDKMVSEGDGRLLKVKTPTVLLEGAFCDGKAHGKCDRYCFAFWREAWLKKLPDRGRIAAEEN